MYELDSHRGGRGIRHKVRKIFHIKIQFNTQKRQKSGPPLDFLTTPSTPLKRNWPKPQGPPLDFQLLCIYECARHESINCYIIVENDRDKAKEKLDFKF